MKSKSPFKLNESFNPTLRQIAIATLIQHIWDASQRSFGVRPTKSAHKNCGVPQSGLPSTDRWANTFSAIAIDRWIEEFTARRGGYSSLSQGLNGVRRAANFLFMLWSIARFGANSDQSQCRRQPASIHDIPIPDLVSMQKWWQLSVSLASDQNVNHRFEEFFRPTFSQVILDRCIARAAIACHHLSDNDLCEIANELNLENWANRLSNLDTARDILQRQSVLKSCPIIMITGPTSTRKSIVAWKLASNLGGAVVAIDPFQICAVLPFCLGVGLPLSHPPSNIQSCLYRSRRPGCRRPSPQLVANWVGKAVDECQNAGIPAIVEGGSISTAMALYQRRIPSHVIVFSTNLRHADRNVVTRMRTDKMNSENLLREARAIRESGLGSTWIARESLVYPEVYRCLDGQTNTSEMISRIQGAWRNLIKQQQDWFEPLRNKDDVIELLPSRQSADCICQLIEDGKP